MLIIIFYMRYAKFLLLITTLSLFSCSNESYLDTKNRDYKTYYQDFGILNINDEMYSEKSNDYFIYFYGENCKYCTDIKGAVLDYFDAYKNHKVKNSFTPFIYDRDIETNIDFRNYFKTRPENYSEIINTLVDEMLGAKSIKDTYFFYTPSIYFIKKHTLVDYKYGSKELAKYFKSQIK